MVNAHSTQLGTGFKEKKLHCGGARCLWDTLYLPFHVSMNLKLLPKITVFIKTGKNVFFLWVDQDLLLMFNLASL